MKPNKVTGEANPGAIVRQGKVEMTEEEMEQTVKTMLSQDSGNDSDDDINVFNKKQDRQCAAAKKEKQAKKKKTVALKSELDRARPQTLEQAAYDLLGGDLTKNAQRVLKVKVNASPELAKSGKKASQGKKVHSERKSQLDGLRKMARSAPSAIEGLE